MIVGKEGVAILSIYNSFLLNKVVIATGGFSGLDSKK